ncbi:hypothetical protein BJV74DRAFT_807376 [Russula compacta]|nr:hypothetical protein BJV74DRAFT_807376 [Russula compacta]
MVPLPTFQLPLPSHGPPSGYGWSDCALSDLSTTTAFNTGLNNRDKFLGAPRCIVCGYRRSLEHCHVIMESQEFVVRRGWIPSQAKERPGHELRNGLLMCPNHHRAFDEYLYFIRFCPDVKKFVLINYSDLPEFRPFHGKAIAIDIKDRHAPFPSIFIIHEMRVRGHNPFQAVIHNMPDDIPWQDWILSEGVFNYTSGGFTRGRRPGNSNNSASAPTRQQLPPMTTSSGASSSGCTIALNADVITDILASTHAMPSWKACQIEGTSWAGTGEENIQKYVSSIGVHC